MMLTLFTILCLYISASTAVDSNPIVSTIYGKVRGESLKTFSQNDFFSFQGIPFAEPPVGPLRFQPPQPPKNWDNIIYKQNAEKRCVESNADFQPGEGEDCLYLNVYTPKIPNDGQNVSLPVLVFIHGGAFVFGRNSIKDHKPYKIMDYGIVMVTIQYRLGLFGFLSTGDLECPGNNGFKDQQFALRWIQANIHNFGGDPTKVTISGESAGSSSVGYQLLGTNSEGLFRGAIQASGSPLGSWCLQRDPKGNAYKIANYIDPKINETNTSTKDLVNLFRTLDVPLVKKIGDALYNKEPSILAFNSYEGFIYMGVIEPEHDGAFLTENAFKKFETGDFNLVPTLIGTTSEESRNLVHVPQIQEILSRYDASPDLIATPSMHLVDQNIKIDVGKEIKRFYVGERLFNESQGPSLKFMSDAGFGRSIIKQAQMQADYSDVYFYEFGYSGDVMRLLKPVKYIPEAGSVGHVEDEAYVFLEISEVPEIYSRRDLLTINRMVLLWTNFVKYLNPTPEPDDILQNIILPKLSKGSFPYLAINDTLEVKYDLKKSMMEKYDRLFDLYALSPLDTY